MAGTIDPEVTDAKRVRQFAAFFKSYMGISAFVVAALPVPVAYIKLMPVYELDRGSTSVITSLVCFLILSFIFYSRHRMARILFFEAALEPAETRSGSAKADYRRLREVMIFNRMVLSIMILSLIVASCIMFFLYQDTWMKEGAFLGVAPRPTGTATRMKLMIFYMVFFGCAEAAFVLMASREYLQDILRLSDTELIRGRQAEQ